MYTLYFFGHTGGPFAKLLEKELNTHLEDFGLELGTSVESLTSADDFDSSRTDSMIVGLWFGGCQQSSDDETVAKKLLDNGHLIFPIVESLYYFTRDIPQFLHPYNGMEEDVTVVSAEILSAFRLLRQKRKVFISYRRNESSGIANQLFETLSHNGYQPFLDTASISKGADFQADLFEELSDVDLIILLYTKSALDSEWVEQETLKAQVHGIGTLQVMWPKVNSKLANDLNVKLHLNKKDFDDHYDKADTRLTNEAHDKLLLVIEKERISSVANRRSRIVGELIDLASKYGYKSILQHDGGVDLKSMKNDKIVASVTPYIGLPDAKVVQYHESAWLSNQDSPDNAALVFDELSVGAQLQKHLDWLDDKIETKLCPIGDIVNWMDKL